jgi:adenine phosphoribosyltransferase
VDYVVIRKTEKPYMRNQLVEKTKSITTDTEQALVLDGADIPRLTGKRVCVVDDVVSTGGSLASIKKLLARLPCVIIAMAAALLEEGGYDGGDLIYLERLPVFAHAIMNRD